MKIEDNAGIEAARAAGVNPVLRTGPAFNLFQTYGVQAPVGADSAALSGQSLEIQAFTEKVQALSDIREDKVRAVAEKLDSGSYRVPIEDLAEAMFRLAELDQPE